MSGTKVDADFWMSEHINPWDTYVHGIRRVLVSQRTAYQQMAIVESGIYGKALVLDGKWQSSTGDEFLYHEALVHPALISHGSPRQVLVLGGGEGATVREVLRWKTLEKVVMVDIDGDVVAACQEHLPEMHQQAFADPRVELVIGDALHYLDTTTADWDVIISDLSDPIEAGPSFPLFTVEYFQKVRQALRPEGIFVLQSGPVSPPDLAAHGRLVKTVQAVFPHVFSYSSFVPTYGAPWSFTLGSAQPLNQQPEPKVVDALLASQVEGELRMLDGMTLLGLLQTPKHTRQAIAAATQIYTMKDPPKFFS